MGPDIEQPDYKKHAVVPSALTDVLAASTREKIYSAQWDAYYYADTGEWAEKQCSDPSCEFCVNRPISAFKADNAVYAPK